jgi:thiol-disulfide isomerase/thioredoxin
MKKLFFLFLLTPFLVRAQEDKGVHFEHDLSWAAIQAKAKAENKYIFMDCFTTWCGPCKYMATQIFPQEISGNYFNDKFISVSVQLDTSAADNAAVRSWYADAHALMEQYGIRAYPTFLVFAPDGHPVHRLVGSTTSAADFNARVAQSFIPDKQYYTLLDQYKKGRKDSAFLHKMASAAWEAYDKQNGFAVSAAYLATQPDLYTRANLEFINSYLETPKDPGFDVLLKDPARVDKVLGEGKAERKIVQVVIFSQMRPMFYKGETPPALDWVALQKDLAGKYPQEAEEIIAQSKVLYYQQKNDWPGFQQAIVSYMNKFGAHAEPEELNDYAWTVFQHCPDMTCVSNALEWSKRSFDGQHNPMFMDTYANILYKMGKKDEAIAWEQKAINLVAEGEKPNYQQTIDKMKKGEKTWD